MLGAWRRRKLIHFMTADDGRFEKKKKTRCDEAFAQICNVLHALDDAGVRGR